MKEISDSFVGNSFRKTPFGDAYLLCLKQIVEEVGGSKGFQEKLYSLSSAEYITNKLILEYSGEAISTSETESFYHTVNMINEEVHEINKKYQQNNKKTSR